MNPARPRGRRPGAPETRAEILDAALALFAERGFERATVRAIAARAGVDPAMVHHYFGTKEDLLAASITLPEEVGVITDLIREGTLEEAEALVRALLSLWDDPRVRSTMQALLRVGMSHERAAVTLRDTFADQTAHRLAETLGGVDAELRAGLVATQVSGLALLRIVVGYEPIAEAEADVLVAAVAPTIHRYLVGDLGPAAPLSGGGPRAQ